MFSLRFCPIIFVAGPAKWLVHRRVMRPSCEMCLCVCAFSRFKPRAVLSTYAANLCGIASCGGSILRACMGLIADIPCDTAGLR